MIDSSTQPFSLDALIDDLGASSPTLDASGRQECLLRILGEAACHRLGLYRVPEDLTLSVVIPVYNERNTLREILRRVRTVPINKQIVLVDDCSTDGTRQILQELATEQPDLTIINHEKNDTPR